VQWSRRRLPAIFAATLLLVLVGAVLLARRLIADLPASPAPEASLAAVPPPVPPEDRTPEIRGRILDADGNAVKGAAVRLVSASVPYTIFSETRSDPAGTFSFPHVASERVRVVADHDPDGAVTSAELLVGKGQTITITLVLSVASAVRGNVVDADDHAVPGASIYLEGVPWMARGTTSDADGAFRLAMVPDGVTSLVAVARGYRTARVPLAHREDQADLVVRVKLIAAAPVEGDVRDPDGNPVRARVVACEGQPSEASTVSADDGTFTLPASAIGCNAVAQHDAYEASDAAVLVEGGRVELRLKPGGAIEGVVVDESGAAVTSFTVGIESFAGAQTRSLRSTPASKVEDANGAFRLEKLAPGRYVLSAGTAGKAPTRSDAVDVAGGATTSGVRIVLGSSGSVTGHVVDEHQVPLEGVELRFDAVSSVIDSSTIAKTDASGQYRLDGAPSGPFTLRAQKEGFRVRLLSGLRVEGHGTLVKDVTLSAVAGGAGIELAGVGASLTPTAEGILFSAVFPGDPAERAGLRAGDRVVGIDGESTQGMSVADALQRLRGEVGTSVGVSVVRPRTGETVDVTIERAAIVH
jgi:hypothetical protein